MASKAARRGIKTEARLVDAVNCMDELGRTIIRFLENSLNQKLTNCRARRMKALGKADVIISCSNVNLLFSVKAFDVKADYNHVERNYVDFYAEKWSMPKDVYRALKLYVGEVDVNGEPTSLETVKKDAERVGTSPGKLSKKRRKFLNRIDFQSMVAVIRFFKSNKDEILKDIFIDEEDVKFFIIARREDNEVCYYIVPTEDVLATYGSGSIEITRRGNLSFYSLTVQRKGGDHRTKHGWVNKTASHLQFKMKPSQCIRNRKPIICEEVV